MNYNEYESINRDSWIIYIFLVKADRMWRIALKFMETRFTKVCYVRSDFSVRNVTLYDAFYSETNPIYLSHTFHQPHIHPSIAFKTSLEMSS